MNNYHSYRSAQVDPYMPPYYSEYSEHPQSPSIRRRPMPLPLSYKRSWRDRFSMMIGLVIISLAIATLFLGSPERYIENAVLPKRMVSPERWEKLFGLSETDQPSRDSSMEVEQQQENIIQEETIQEETIQEGTIQEETIQEETIQEDVETSSGAQDTKIEENIVQKDVETSSEAQDTEIEVIKKSTHERPTPRAHVQDKRASDMMALNSTYVAQITAERNHASAERYYYNLLSQHGDLLESLKFTVTPVDLGARGIFYRLYVLPFTNRDRANDLCVALKQRGEDCFVRKR